MTEIETLSDDLDTLDIKEIAHANFDKWNQTLLTKDPAAVAALYTSDNDFLPTLSPDFKRGIAGAADYFTHFLEKNPTGEIVEDNVQELSPDAILHSGMYNFTVGQEDNRQVVEARFTFVYKKDGDGEWKIAHHHSSLKPQAH